MYLLHLYYTIVLKTRKNLIGGSKEVKCKRFYINTYARVKRAKRINW